MKRFLGFVLAVIFLISFAAGAFAQEIGAVKVHINGLPLYFDVPPMIVEGRTMVPVRKIFEAQGAEVTWLQDMQLVLATYKMNIIAIPIGAMSFSVTDVVSNETTSFELDVPAQIIDGRTLVPARAISEALGKKVDWDNDTRTVLITDIQ